MLISVNPLERVALKACSVMQCLLLQKPHAKSKTKEHVSHLERRMKLWSQRDVDALLYEGKCIQKHLTSSKHRTVEFENIARGFSRLMLQGKVHQAVRLISNAEKGDLLAIDELIPTGIDEKGNTNWQTTRDILIQKHPEAKIPPPAETLLPEPESDETYHAAFSHVAFSHVIMGKWQYIMRTIKDVGGLPHPIEEAIY